ncbi:MAG: hypothetical protein DRZ82_07420 [Thermoprotei archaeon]|nr:MAG: hypothetical protein DRZ82_07420 [Thermoprotei archaeon]
MTAMPFLPEWEFSIRRNNRGYLVYGIIMLFMCVAFATYMFMERCRHWLYFLPSFVLLSLSILFIVLYISLPKDIIVVKKDMLHLIRGTRKIEIPFSRIVSVNLVYEIRLGHAPVLSHLTIKYRDAMSYSKIRSLKLRTLSWSENDIADLYRYLNLFRERYRYDVKVVKTLFTFMH